MVSLSLSLIPPHPPTQQDRRQDGKLEIRKQTHAGTAGVVSDDNSAVDGPPCDSAMVFSVSVAAGRRLAMMGDE